MLILVALIAIVPICALAAYTVKRPAVAVALVAASIPFETVPYSVAGLSITKAAGFGSIAVLVLAWAAQRLPGRRRVVTIDLIVVLLVFGVTVASIGTPFPRDMGDVFQFVRVVLLFVCTRVLIASYRDIQLILVTYLHAVTVAGIVGVAQVLLGAAERDYALRAGGISMDPNDFAVLASIALVVALQARSWSSRRAHRAYYAVLAMIEVVVIVMTGSRAGLIILALVAVAWWWQQPRRSEAALAACGLAVAVVLAAPETIRTRILSGTGFEAADSPVAQSAVNSVDRRTAYVTYGFQLFSDRPWLGWGYGSFKDLFIYSDFARFANPQTINDAERIAHNVFVEFAVSGGMITIFSWIVLLVACAVALRRVRRRAPSGSTAAEVVFALELTLLCLVVGGFFLSIQHDKMWWILFGCAAALDQWRSVETDRPNAAEQRMSGVPSSELSSGESMSSIGADRRPAQYPPVSRGVCT